MRVEARERETHLRGQEVGRPQLCSLVGPPGPVGTTDHCTGSVPNARLPVWYPETGEEAASGEGAGAEIVGPNLPEDPSWGKCSDHFLWLIRFIDFVLQEGWAIDEAQKQVTHPRSHSR